MSCSGISWAICKFAPRSRQITTPAPHHSVFTGRMPFLPPNQQRQSTEAQCTCYAEMFGKLTYRRALEQSGAPVGRRAHSGADAYRWSDLMRPSTSTFQYTDRPTERPRPAGQSRCSRHGQPAGLGSVDRSVLIPASNCQNTCPEWTSYDWEHAVCQVSAEPEPFIKGNAVNISKLLHTWHDNCMFNGDVITKMLVNFCKFRW